MPMYNCMEINANVFCLLFLEKNAVWWDDSSFDGVHGFRLVVAFHERVKAQYKQLNVIFAFPSIFKADAGWSEWGEWSSPSENGTGTEILTRHRTCDNFLLENCGGSLIVYDFKSVQYKTYVHPASGKCTQSFQILKQIGPKIHVFLPVSFL